MKKKYLYLIIIAISLVFVSVVKADTDSKFVTTKYFSKNRAFYVIVTPDKKAILYKGKTKIWTILLPELPGKILVSNDGNRVIMMENYYGNNNDRKKEVLIFFDEKGIKLKSYDLESLADFNNVLHTNSGSHWLKNYEVDEAENELIINTVVISCPLIEKNSKIVDLKKIDECKKPKPNETIKFSLSDGKLLSRTKTETVEK